MGYCSALTLGVNSTIKRRHAKVANIATQAPPPPPPKRPCPLFTLQFEHVCPLRRGYGVRLELPSNLGAMVRDSLLYTEPINAVSGTPSWSNEHALTTKAPATADPGFLQKT